MQAPRRRGDEAAQEVSGVEHVAGGEEERGHLAAGGEPGALGQQTAGEVEEQAAAQVHADAVAA